MDVSEVHRTRGKICSYVLKCAAPPDSEKDAYYDNLTVCLLFSLFSFLLRYLFRNPAANAYYIVVLFLSLLVAAFIFTGKKIKKSVFNASFLTLVLVIILFGINYLFAISEQSLNKYLYYLEA